MSLTSDISRRRFVVDACLASAVPLAACTGHSGSPAPIMQPAPAAAAWDLSWTHQLAPATDRAVFDWPTLGSPTDSIVLQIAERYLDNCAVAYPAGSYKAIAVMNIRTTAIPAAMTDAAWQTFALGAEYQVVDPATQSEATRNPFWSRAGAPATPGSPTLQELVSRSAILLVCDFAMGHLANRLASKRGLEADAVHLKLRQSLVPGAYAVPSGIFGLARAQNAGCAFVRM